MSKALQPPRGTRDFPPAEFRLREWLFEHFRAVSERFGFEGVDAPVLEYEELFTRKAGEEITKQLYHFELHGRRYVLRPTLPRLRDMGCEVILGLREVLDEPSVVRDEWARSDALRSVSEYYDRIWVYGSKDFSDPLSGVPLPVDVRERIEHVGFLARTVPTTVYSGAHSLPAEFVLKLLRSRSRSL